MLALLFVLFVMPGSALMYFVFRFIKASQLVSVAQTDRARMGARLEAARDASAVAQGTAREALAQTGAALEVARTIELVDEKVSSLTSYLVTQIEGRAPEPRGAGRHSRPALPGADEPAAIDGGPVPERFLP